MHQTTGNPNADLGLAFGLVGDKMQVNIFSGFNAWDLQGISAQGDFAIAIRNALKMNAEDILG